MTNITFATCWFTLKSKFNKRVYLQWIKNFLQIQNANIVIFTNEPQLFSSVQNQKNFRIIETKLEDLSLYQHKDFWMENHKKNYLLNDKICWELNMLWCEKTNFVEKAMKYFSTDYYGWCDIGYFRCRNNDLPFEKIKEFPNQKKINQLDPKKIHYAQVQRNEKYMEQLKEIVSSPLEIPSSQVSVAGGFFICHKDMVEWWNKKFNKLLKYYIDKKNLVKDDQIIIIESIFSNEKYFQLHTENDIGYDNWFLFSRKLI